MDRLKGMAVAAATLVASAAVAQDVQTVQREEAQLIDALVTGTRCSAVDAPQRIALDQARQAASLRLRLANAAAVDDAAVERLVADGARAGSAGCSEELRAQVRQIANNLITIQLIRANAALDASRALPWARGITALDPHAAGIGAQVARIRTGNPQAASQLEQAARAEAAEALALICERRSGDPRRCPGGERSAPQVELASQWLAAAEAVVGALAAATPAPAAPPAAARPVMPESLVGYYRLVSLGSTGFDVGCTPGDWVVKDPKPGENALFRLGTPQAVGTVSLIERNSVWAVVGYDEAATRANAGGAATILPCRI